MKRFLIATVGIMTFAAMALAAGNGLAFGHGSFKASDTTVAMFDFHAGSKDGNVRGCLFFMEGGRDGIKHTIRMKVEKFEVDATGHGAFFAGPCRFDGKEAFAQVGVFDAGRGIDKKDIFKIHVGDPTGNEIYMAGGEVGRGNIVVRAK